MEADSFLRGPGSAEPKGLGFSPGKPADLGHNLLAQKKTRPLPKPRPIILFIIKMKPDIDVVFACEIHFILLMEEILHHLECTKPCK